MTFSGALTAFEAISWSSLNYRAFANRQQVIQPPDLPCVVLDLAEQGAPSLIPQAINFTKASATIWLDVNLLISSVQARPANPFATVDTFFGKVMDNPLLSANLTEPMSFVMVKSGLILRGASGYFGFVFLMKWTVDVE